MSENRSPGAEERLWCGVLPGGSHAGYPVNLLCYWFLEEDIVALECTPICGPR